MISTEISDCYSAFVAEIGVQTRGTGPLFWRSSASGKRGSFYVCEWRHQPNATDDQLLARIHANTGGTSEIFLPYDAVGATGNMETPKILLGCLASELAELGEWCAQAINAIEAGQSAPSLPVTGLGNNFTDGTPFMTQAAASRAFRLLTQHSFEQVTASR